MQDKPQDAKLLRGPDVNGRGMNVRLLPLPLPQIRSESMLRPGVNVLRTLHCRTKEVLRSTPPKQRWTRLPLHRHNGPALRDVTLTLMPHDALTPSLAAFRCTTSDP